MFLISQLDFKWTQQPPTKTKNKAQSQLDEAPEGFAESHGRRPRRCRLALALRRRVPASDDTTAVYRHPEEMSPPSMGTAVYRHPEATVQLHLEPRARERRPRRRFRALVLIVHEQHMPAAADCASTIDAAPRRLVVAAVVAPQLGEEGPEGWHRQKRASFFSTIAKSPQPAPRVNRKKNRDERIGR